MRLATAIAAALAMALVWAVASPAQDVGTKVVGGNDAEAGDYPWQIGLYKKSGQSFFFTCGGSLIGDSKVVTAAHCMSGNASSYRVFAGGQTLPSTSASLIAVSSYAIHPNYASNTNEFDAATLQLASSGVTAGGQTIQLIGAEGTADDALWADGKTLAISGWGSTSSGGPVVSHLREAEIPRVADSTCGQSDWYGSSFFPATMVCAGPAAGGVDTCQGDSGGPLAAPTTPSFPSSQNNPAEWRLVGLTSWGIGCAQAQKPGVYTRVAAPAIRNWILGGGGSFALTVADTGTGSGSVTSNPTGIDCPTDCGESYPSGTAVTLTAAPNIGSSFDGWSGAGCSGTGTCVVSMSQARSVTATFTSHPQQTLTMDKGGDGTGTVTSTPSGISCNALCTTDSQAFDYGTPVTLSASAPSGATFTGWSGAGCSGTGTCQVTMTQARSVIATFQADKALTVTPAGAGSGTVTSSPVGINCGSTCAANFAHGTSVTLSASPAVGSTFGGWSGEGCSGTGTCQVTMTQARTVTATFTPQPPQTLSLTKAGDGSGTVTSTPAGINCDASCTSDSHGFDYGTPVTLSASPQAGSTFAGWGGACSGTGSCQVTMTQVRNVTATFNSQKTLTVTNGGGGTVTSSPAGISCGSTCSVAFNHGTAVTLSATPAPNYGFAGWSGACTGTGGCQVTMTQVRDVTATFSLIPATPDPGTGGDGGGGGGGGTGTNPLQPNEPFAPLVDTVAPRVSLPLSRLRATRLGYIKLPILCPDTEPESCVGTVKLLLVQTTAATRTVAKGSFRITPGAKKRLRMRLSRFARHRLARNGRIRVRAVVVVTDEAKNSRTIRHRLTILRAG